MIDHVTGGRVLPKAIADQIIDRTDGVPLFIEELTKSVVESGLVTKAGDRYAVAGPTAPLAIPTTLQASLLARLDRLAQTLQVQLAQVEGLASGGGFGGGFSGGGVCAHHRRRKHATIRVCRFAEGGLEPCCLRGRYAQRPFHRRPSLGKDRVFSCWRYARPWRRRFRTGLAQRLRYRPRRSRLPARQARIDLDHADWRDPAFG